MTKLKESLAEHTPNKKFRDFPPSRLFGVLLRIFCVLGGCV